MFQELKLKVVVALLVLMLALSTVFAVAEYDHAMFDDGASAEVIAKKSDFGDSEMGAVEDPTEGAGGQDDRGDGGSGFNNEGDN